MELLPEQPLRLLSLTFFLQTDQLSNVHDLVEAAGYPLDTHRIYAINPYFRDRNQSEQVGYLVEVRPL